MEATRKDLIAMGVKKGVQIQIKFEDENYPVSIGRYLWSHENNYDDKLKTITIKTKDGENKFIFVKNIKNIKVLKNNIA